MVDADYPSRPRGFAAPYRGDTGSFSLQVNVGGDAPMDSLTEVVLGLQALVDVGKVWGTALAASAAMWDLSNAVDRDGREGLFQLAEDEDSAYWVRRLWRFRHPFEWWGWGDSPELRYLRDSRAVRLQGEAMRVRALTYENPVELVLSGSGLLLLGALMAARFVRDWSANRRIAVAEARKVEAEARVAETWADREEALTTTITNWLGQEAKDTSTPLPISEMAAVTSMHNFANLRRVIERPVTLELPQGLDPTNDEQ